MDVNARYYGSLKQGQRDYWRYMAAPRRRIATAMSILSGSAPRKICDLGCGDGSLLSALHRRFPGADLVGIDRSSAQIEENRTANPLVSWHAMDLDGPASLPPTWSGTCDAVTALEVIEHVSTPSRLLSHAFALASSGGRLVLSTQSGPVRETEKRVGHQRHFSAAEMTDLLKSSGWRPVSVWNSGWPFHDLSKWAANLSPDRSMREFGEGAYTRTQRFLCAVLRGLFKFNSGTRGAQLFAVAEKPNHPTKMG